MSTTTKQQQQRSSIVSKVATLLRRVKTTTKREKKKKSTVAISKKEQPPSQERVTFGVGVVFVTDHQNQKSCEDSYQHCCNSSIDTSSCSQTTADLASVFSDDTCPSQSSSSNGWVSTDTESYYKTKQPLYVSPNDESEEIELETKTTRNTNSSKREKTNAELFDTVLQKTQQLPGTWYFSSNHILVNTERSKRLIAPLIRDCHLDELARYHATAMVEESRVYHSSPVELQCKLFSMVAADTQQQQQQTEEKDDSLSSTTPTGSSTKHYTRYGENIACGTSIRSIHTAMVECTISEKNNILDRRYTHFGMGTTYCSETNELYLCQLFRGV